jgi:hypothetical protein
MQSKINIPTDFWELQDLRARQERNDTPAAQMGNEMGGGEQSAPSLLFPSFFRCTLLNLSRYNNSLHFFCFVLRIKRRNSIDQNLCFHGYNNGIASQTD